ncbi:MAG: type II secretion system F family protein [Candidatus Melainabacteria bacterium]|nr:type II secretion system F family protein [Candidatus Melainabacteria bacterium]MBI3308552.1 type II secretion system F family protein [Candidatus Melainabacteria bacterium]
MTSIVLILISLCAFGAVVITSIVVFRMREMQNESKEINKRLKFWLSERSVIRGQAGSYQVDSTSQEESFTKRVLLPMGEQVGKWMAEKSPMDKQSELRRKLIAAGYRDKRALIFFYAIKIAFAGGAAVISLFLLSLLGGVKAGMFYALIGAALGFILPNITLDKKAEERKHNIDRVLPDALDLLVICTEAGMGIDLALLRVAANLGSNGKDLSEEIVFTNREMNLGQERSQCWNNLGERTGTEELKNLARIISQSEKVGASIANVLRSQSEFLRVKRRQKAEEQAAKVTVKMMIPMALFIFPCIMTVIIAPVILQFMSSFKGGIVE